MLSNRRSMIVIQNAVLIFIATFFAGIIFLVDLNTTNTVAVASMYVIVILYSWLLPGKFSSVYVAAGCSFLTIISVVLTKEMSTNTYDLSSFNMVISLVVIWTSVTLVFIAKSSFANLDDINKQLSASSSALLETIRELDAQQLELSANKVELEELNTDLTVKNRELERFTSIASHDLQEPLRTIGNMTQLITKKYHPLFDDQGKKMLDYVTTATNRMTVLIKGLLEFSRIGNTLETKEVDCRELVSTIVLDFEAVLKSVNGVVKVDELPVVRGNPIELRMLFQNLISNGLKFRRPNTRPTVEVSATNGTTHVEFCVRDNGIGIDQNDYERIFLIFQRLHGVEEFEGTGLGLAYCRKIVELHGGKMWIRSKKGVGSSFYFTLAKII